MASEGIEYRPDGTINITIDGVVRHLRRPKLREYRHWYEQLRDLAKSAQAEAVELQNMIAELDATDNQEELDRLQGEFEDAQRRRMEYTTPWTAGVVNQFSEKDLPADPDDWPSWLAMDTLIPATILNHWKKTPLAPGAAGTN